MLGVPSADKTHFALDGATQYRRAAVVRKRTFGSETPYITAHAGHTSGVQGHACQLRTDAHRRSAGVGRRRELVVERVQPRARAAACQQPAGVIQQLIEPLQIVHSVTADEDRTAVILHAERSCVN